MAVAPEMPSDRPSLGRIPDPVELPDLIEIQTKSYSDFLQWDVPPEERECIGLQEVFMDVFPIESPDGMTKAMERATRRRSEDDVFRRRLDDLDRSLARIARG